MVPDLTRTRRSLRKSVPTIQRLFDPRSNSLNAIRLALAVLVIVSHSWPIGGYGKEPGVGAQHLGDWAVAGFFATSGYLITASRIRSRSFIDYLWRRILRIYPAFFVVLVMVAFVIAPLASTFLGAGTWTPFTALQYLVSDLGLWMARFGIDGMLTTVPFPGSWNGSLWTLAFEFGCYMLIGLVVGVVPRSRLGAAVVTLFVIAVVGAAFTTGGMIHVPQVVEQFIYLFGYFLAGSMLYLARGRVPLTVPLAVVAAILTIVAVVTDTFRATAGLPVAYLMVALGAFLPLRRVGARNDISYGMYIYAFPIQQLLALTLITKVLPVWAFVLIAIAGTLPLAWASWILVERPAMKLKILTARANVDPEGHVIGSPGGSN